MKVQRINIYHPQVGVTRLVVDVDEVETGKQLEAMQQLQSLWPRKDAEENFDHINGNKWQFRQEYKDVD